MTLLRKFERVLDLLQRALELGLPAEPGSADFGQHLAFRWEVRGSGGSLLPIPDPRLFELPSYPKVYQ